MRPRILDALESSLGWENARYLLPGGTTILTLAIALVLWVTMHRARSTGVPLRPLVLSGLLGVASGLLGSRLFHMAQHLPRFLADPERIWAWGGTTSWGGYILGTAVFVGCLALDRRPLLVHLDLLGSALGLGPFVARWGCFMNGCCFGVPSSLPWAVRYPSWSFAHAAHVEAGLAGRETLSAPVHPTQIYASLLGLALFVAASRVWHRYRDRPGVTIAFYWTAYASLRFPLEFLRGDVPRFWGGTLTLSQILCLLAAGAGSWCLALALRRPPSAPNPVPAASV